MVAFKQISDPSTFPVKAAEDEALKQILDLHEKAKMQPEQSLKTEPICPCLCVPPWESVAQKELMPMSI